MNMILDAVIAVILVASFIIGWKKGLAEMLGKIVVFAASYIGASWVTAHVAAPVTRWLQPRLVEQLTERFTAKGVLNLSSLPQSVRDLVDAASAAGKAAAESAASAMLYSVIRVIIFVVCLILLRYLLRVVVNPLTRLFRKLPLVGLANGIVGAVLGLIGGLLVAFILAWALERTNIVPQSTIKDTFLLSFFADHSPVDLVNTLLGEKEFQVSLKDILPKK